MFSYLKSFFVDPTPQDYYNEAKSYEDNFDYTKAIEKYEIATYMFYEKKDIGLYVHCAENLAILHIQSEHYERAIELYEKLVLNIGDVLHTINPINYLFYASLCRLLLGNFNKSIMDKYENMLRDPFEKSHQGQFLIKLMDAIEEKNVNSFTNAVIEWDDMNKLAPWQTTVLLRIKQTFPQ